MKLHLISALPLLVCLTLGFRGIVEIGAVRSLLRRWPNTLSGLSGPGMWKVCLEEMWRMGRCWHTAGSIRAFQCWQNHCRLRHAPALCDYVLYQDSLFGTSVYGRPRSEKEARAVQLGQ